MNKTEIIASTFYGVNTEPSYECMFTVKVGENQVVINAHGDDEFSNVVFVSRRTGGLENHRRTHQVDFVVSRRTGGLERKERVDWLSSRVSRRTGGLERY